jgi:hypothetical protein
VEQRARRSITSPGVGARLVGERDAELDEAGMYALVAVSPYRSRQPPSTRSKEGLGELRRGRSGSSPRTRRRPTPCRTSAPRSAPRSPTAVHLLVAVLAEEEHRVTVGHHEPPHVAAVLPCCAVRRRAVTTATKESATILAIRDADARTGTRPPRRARRRAGQPDVAARLPGPPPQLHRTRGGGPTSELAAPPMPNTTRTGTSACERRPQTTCRRWSGARRTCPRNPATSTIGIVHVHRRRRHNLDRKSRRRTQGTPGWPMETRTNTATAPHNPAWPVVVSPAAHGGGGGLPFCARLMMNRCKAALAVRLFFLRNNGARM